MPNSPPTMSLGSSGDEPGPMRARASNTIVVNVLFFATTSGDGVGLARNIAASPAWLKGMLDAAVRGGAVAAGVCGGGGGGGGTAPQQMVRKRSEIEFKGSQLNQYARVGKVSTVRRCG